MLLVVLFLRDGLFGIKAQFRAWRDKKKSERRSTRAEKGGEMLPEEATETHDKDVVYWRRFDKMQRDYLKTLVTPEVIEEHQQASRWPAQRSAGAAADLLPRPAPGRQVCDHGGRAVQGLSDRRSVGPSRCRPARGRGQDLCSHRKRPITACSCAVCRTCSNPEVLRARLTLKSHDQERSISGCRWHRSRSLVTRTRSR